jgi:hypothetical protein
VPGETEAQYKVNLLADSDWTPRTKSLAETFFVMAEATGPGLIFSHPFRIFGPAQTRQSELVQTERKLLRTGQSLETPRLPLQHMLEHSVLVVQGVRRCKRIDPPAHFVVDL